MSPPRPKRIILEKSAQELVIEWSDNHLSRYSLDGLRRTCPCAACSGGHDQMGELPDPAVFKVPALMKWNQVRLEPVGTYALSITWDDGHNAGIYTWERLRASCPCAQCYPSNTG